VRDVGRQFVSRATPGRAATPNRFRRQAGTTSLTALVHACAIAADEVAICVVARLRLRAALAISTSIAWDAGGIGEWTAEKEAARRIGTRFPARAAAAFLRIHAGYQGGGIWTRVAAYSAAKVTGGTADSLLRRVLRRLRNTDGIPSTPQMIRNVLVAYAVTATAEVAVGAGPSARSTIVRFLAIHAPASMSCPRGSRSDTRPPWRRALP
jgi:hypothetical protein